MKHERTKEGGSITLKPGESWTVDQQCMIMAIGYLADWQPYNQGDVFLNNGDREYTFDIDYGCDDPNYPPRRVET